MANKFGANERTGLGKEMQDVLLEGAGLTRQQFNAIINLGQTYQDVNVKNMSAGGKFGLARRAWNLIITRGAAQSSAAAELMSKVGKNHSFMEYLQEGGAEEFLRKHPGFKPANVSKFKTWVDDWQMPKPVKATGRAGTRQKGTQGMADLTGNETDMEQ